MSRTDQPSGARRIVSELPFLAGIAVALVHLWRVGRWLQPTGHPTGFDAREYLFAAWLAANGVDHGFPVFRAALWPWAAGTLGEHVGYVTAAQLLSSGGVAAVVFGAGLLARAFGGPWAGGAASVLVAAAPPLLVASSWTSPYAAVAGLLSLSLGLAAVAARSGSWVAAGAAALAGGLATAADDRSLVPFVGALLATLVGLGHVSSRRKGALLVVALGLAAVGPSIEARVAVTEQASLEWRIQKQRSNDLRSLADSGQRALVEACADEPREALPTLAAFRRPCGAALRTANLVRLATFAPLPLSAVLLGALLLLVPARGWRTAPLASVALFGPTLGVLGAMLHWTTLSDRYLLPSLAVLAALLPVAAARLASWAPERYAAVTTAIASLAVVLALGWHGLPRPLPMDAGDDPRAWAIVDEVRARVPVAAPLLDCSAKGLATSLLPDRYGQAPAELNMTNYAPCTRWVDEAPADAWILTGAICASPPPCERCVEAAAPPIALQCTGGRRDPRCVGLSATGLAARGWERAAYAPGVARCADGAGLWRRVGTSAAAGPVTSPVP